MGGLRQLDWQMVSFVALSVCMELLGGFRYPRIYYCSAKREPDGKAHSSDDDNHRAA